MSLFSVAETEVKYDIESLKKSALNIQIFEEYSEEWADFVFNNRDGIETPYFDFVYGPIANDKVGLQMRK